jgi:hypothetical protein
MIEPLGDAIEPTRLEVVLYALPNTIENRDIARMRTYVASFADDITTYDRDQPNVVTRRTTGPTHRAMIARFQDLCATGRIDRLIIGIVRAPRSAASIDVGYWSSTPMHATFTYWRRARMLTEETRAATLARLHVPNRAEVRDPVVRRRDARRWLTAHLGQITWGEFV